MKKIIVSFIFIFILGLVASCAVSSGCTNHYDNNNDGLCDNCNKFLEKVETEHEWKEPVFTWDNYSSAFATFVCNLNSEHTNIIDAIVTSEITLDTTCAKEGLKTYTATVEFNGSIYTDIKEETLLTVEHNFTKEVIDSKTLKEPATCETKATYWYSCTECDAISNILYFESGDGLKHTWHELDFEWDGYVSSSKTFVCLNDNTHTEILDAIITNELTEDSTCTKEGIRTYTATVEFNGSIYTDIKEETLPKVDHDVENGKCISCDLIIYNRTGENNEYILFGTYPQSEVTDTNITNELTTLSGTLPTETQSGNWTAYGYYIECNITNYMWYQDVTYNSELYRGVYFTSYRPYRSYDVSSTDNSYQDDNGYNINTVYWFKYEPIKWRILTEESGKALILCEMSIDSQEYYHENNSRTIDGKTIYENNYEYSNIRKWLNDNFYNTAFNDLQKEIIELTLVNNSASTTENSTNQYASNNTNDKVFLLSFKDIKNADYGFSSNTMTNNISRRKPTTSYARCLGAKIGTNSSDYGNPEWLTRSPHPSSSNYIRGITYLGALSTLPTYYTCSGIVPALWIVL